MNITIECREVDAVVEAKVIEVSPILNMSSVAIGTRDSHAHQAAEKLMGVLRHIGYTGSFTVRMPEFHYPALEEPLTDSQWISSDNGVDEYEVTYREGRNPEYICDCMDFTYRRLALDEHCKHIDRAISHFNLGRRIKMA